MVTNAVTSMLIVYALICASYLRFYFWLVFHNGSCRGRRLTGNLFFFSLCSIKHAADRNYYRTSLETPEAYNRNNFRYPYRSHVQSLRAYYGLIACSIIVLFNGWQSFMSPISASDLLASYFSVSRAHYMWFSLSLSCKICSSTCR